MNYMQIQLVSKGSRKKTVFFGRLPLFNCARKKVLFGVRAEILLSRVIATRDSCAGLFLGVVQKYSPLNLFSLLWQRPIYWTFLLCTSSISNICLKQKTDCISHLKRNWQLFNSQYNSLFKKMQVPGD